MDGEIDPLGDIAPHTAESVSATEARLDRLLASIEMHMSHIVENTGKTAADIAELKALEAAKQTVELAQDAVNDTLETGNEAVNTVGAAGSAVPAVAHDTIEDTQKVIDAPHKKKKRTRLF